VPLSDPTCYAPVIDYVRTLAESMDDGKNYVVLLIITDGGISGEFNILQIFQLFPNFKIKMFYSQIETSM
jgi:hypothetical protein